MKNLLSLACVCLALASGAQVQLDKPLQLTGSGADAKVSGIKDVSQAQDAVSAEVAQKNSLTYAPAGGVANAYTVSLTPAVTAYTSGQILSFLANADNTGASTVNVNGLGTRAIKKNFNADLAAGDIKNGQAVILIYDGTTFQMISQLGNAGGGGGSCPSLSIGSAYGGGVVAATNYPNSPCKYLIAASADLANATWGCSGQWIGGTFEGFGTGAHSSAVAAAACGGSTSSGLCESSTAGGFTDWFLPSKEELNQLYRFRTTIGGFNTSAAPPYVSSSEFSSGNPWTLPFNNANGYNSGGYNKNDACRVRCVRAI